MQKLNFLHEKQQKYTQNFLSRLLIIIFNIFFAMHSRDGFNCLHIKWIDIIEEISISKFILIPIHRKQQSRLIFPEPLSILLHKIHDMIPSELLLAHRQVPIQTLRIKIISQCQMFTMCLQLILVLAEQQHKICDYLVRLVFVVIAHLTIYFTQYLLYFLLAVIDKQMQGYLASNIVHLPQNLSSLQYEVTLLRQRNRILTLENEQLITKIQQTQHQLTEASNKLHVLEKEQFLSIQSKNKEKAEIFKLVKVFEQNYHSNDLQFIQEMYRNNCPTYSIIQNLVTIVKSCGQNKENRSNLNRLEKLVNKRKQRMLDLLPKNREIVHIVKQPAKQEVGVSEGDLQFFVSSAEKIIRKVKRFDVKTEGISNVIERLVNLIYLRKSIRQEEKNLNAKEREIELGVGCRMLFEEITARLIQMRREELESKNKIEKLIFQL